MCALRFAWVLALIPASMLLTASFFVLFTARKSDSEALKKFGQVVAVLLWLSAAIVIMAGVYNAVVNPQRGVMRKGCGISGMGMNGKSDARMQMEKMQQMMLENQSGN